MNENYDLLESLGWTVECESPFEIRHEDGSFATQNAAKIVMADIIKEHSPQNSVHSVQEVIANLVAINDYVQNIVINALAQDMDKKEDWQRGADWDSVFGLLFNEDTSTAAFAALRSIGNELDYYDPDTSYQEDVMAFANALNEKVTSLEKLTKKTHKPKRM
jgi:hypothetical protein